MAQTLPLGEDHFVAARVSDETIERISLRAAVSQSLGGGDLHHRRFPELALWLPRQPGY